MIFSQGCFCINFFYFIKRPRVLNSMSRMLWLNRSRHFFIYYYYCCCCCSFIIFIVVVMAIIKKSSSMSGFVWGAGCIGVKWWFMAMFELPKFDQKEIFFIRCLLVFSTPTCLFTPSEFVKIIKCVFAKKRKYMLIYYRKQQKVVFWK